MRNSRTKELDRHTKTKTQGQERPFEITKIFVGFKSEIILLGYNTKISCNFGESIAWVSRWFGLKAPSRIISFRPRLARATRYS